MEATPWVWEEPHLMDTLGGWLSSLPGCPPSLAVFPALAHRPYSCHPQRKAPSSAFCLRSCSFLVSQLILHRPLASLLPGFTGLLLLATGAHLTMQGPPSTCMQPPGALRPGWWLWQGRVCVEHSQGKEMNSKARREQLVSLGELWLCGSQDKESGNLLPRKAGRGLWRQGRLTQDLLQGNGRMHKSVWLPAQVGGQPPFPGANRTAQERGRAPGQGHPSPSYDWVAPGRGKELLTIWTEKQARLAEPMSRGRPSHWATEPVLGCRTVGS